MEVEPHDDFLRVHCVTPMHILVTKVKSQGKWVRQPILSHGQQMGKAGQDLDWLHWLPHFPGGGDV